MAAPRVTPDGWQRSVTDLAHWLGWHVASFRAARTVHGWRTPVSADGKGFPDLLLVRERPIAAELKTGSGRLEPAQLEWKRWFETAGVEWYCWRPHHLETIALILQDRRPSSSLAGVDAMVGTTLSGQASHA